jgi:hypothetical protein
MKHEFKKITKSTETRYVLDEFATGGSTSAAAVGGGNIAGALGAVRKREDNILAQEADKPKVPASKPRNFVAKNAKMGGAGSHKDKKKAQKQGQEKHRKPYMEELKDRIDSLKSRIEEGEYIKRGNPKAYDADVKAASTGFGRPYDHRGLGQELAHEKNNVGIWINGKLWKVLDGSSYPGAYEYATKGANKMKVSIEQNAAAKGRPVPKVEIGATAANPTVEESAPKGWEGTVKAMKKHKEIDNPYALTHWMKNKGMKSHKKEEGVAEDAYMQSLLNKLNERTKK